MKFSQKCMFLGLENRLGKENNTFTILKLLDKTTNENVNLIINKPEKLKDYKPYSDIDLNFNLVKGYNKDTKNYEWKLYLSEE